MTQTKCACAGEQLVSTVALTNRGIYQYSIPGKETGVGVSGGRSIFRLYVFETILM